MNEQPHLPGFEPYPEMQHSLLPDFGQVVTKKLDGFDPHDMMIQKKQKEDNTTATVPATGLSDQSFQEIKALEDFCKRHGIVGFNFGKMSPIAALAFLKGKMGIVEGPYEQRVPNGYQPYNQSKPYQPSILHG